jgi:hypothetical protein
MIPLRNSQIDTCITARIICFVLVPSPSIFISTLSSLSNSPLKHCAHILSTIARSLSPLVAGMFPAGNILGAAGENK